MQKHIIDRRKTGYFSDIANTLVYDQSTFESFISRQYSPESLREQAKKKMDQFSTEQREILTGILEDQHGDHPATAIKENMDKLKQENSVTITTGHQLNLYTGPLYVVYKIIHVLKLAEELNKENTGINYVPVFWMATEDHDFEEINHFHLFHDTISWETEQKGPVGRFNLDDFGKTKEELLEKFENNPEFAAYLDQYYKGESLSQATRRFVMSLFADYGLIIIDADDKRLKKSFAPIMEQELKNQFSEPLVEAYTQKLIEKGYEGQVTPRPINLFLIEDGKRERIIPENGGYKAGEEMFTQEELLNLLNNHPDKFSPNVVLRPIYQEFILPNICYVGGGGEMSYWLQLKGVFDELEILYPVIQVRNSIQIIDGIALKKMNKLNFNREDLFEDIHQLKKQFVLDNEESELDFQELESYQQKLSNILTSLVEDVDKGLSGYGKSEATKLKKQIDGVKQKLIRHQKKKHDDAMAQIDNLFERLFPAGGLQERYDNIIPKLAKYGVKETIDELYKQMDPNEKGLILLTED